MRGHKLCGRIAVVAWHHQGSVENYEVRLAKLLLKPRGRNQIVHTCALSLAAAAIASDSLIGDPQSFGRRARLPEHIDRNSATRIPIAADAEPAGLHLFDQSLADADGDVFMKTRVVAETQEQLERLRSTTFLRRIIVTRWQSRLTGHRAERSKCGTAKRTRKAPDPWVGT